MKSYHIILIIISFIVGFFIGRKTISEEITVLVPQKPISGHIQPVQVTESKPTNPVLPMKDTIYKEKIVIQIVDTAKIIEDYQMLRKYSEMLFDNEFGSFRLNSEVQYNKLQVIDYKFIPIQKVTTISKKKVFTPYIRGSYSTLGYFGAGGGVYYYDFGVDIQYQTDLAKKGIEIGINYKF